MNKFQRIRATCSVVMTLGLAVVAQPTRADVDEAQARVIATDISVLVTAATGVISDLQADINAGKAQKESVTAEAIYDAFLKKYEKNTGKALDSAATGVHGESRKAFVGALKDTITKFNGAIVKGGQDAFVPAFFRAQVLSRYNASMKAKLQVYASTRDSELINSDWSVASVMKGSPLAGEVSGLMNSGKLDPVMKRSGDRLLGYWPMKLGSACVSCHARAGLKQQEGAFGGALVAEVWVK